MSTDGPAIGLVFALTGEGRALPAETGLIATRQAQGPDAAAAAARSLFSDGVELVISFGVAGATAPDPRSGDLLVPHTVCFNQQHYLIDADLRHNFCGRLSLQRPAVVGLHACVDRPICSVNEKRRFHEQSGALAVDMESGAIVAAASEAGRQALVVRAVSDDADTELPTRVGRWTDPSGRTRFATLLGDLLRQPRLIKQLPPMARGYNAALACLSRAVPALLAVASARA